MQSYTKSNIINMMRNLSIPLAFILIFLKSTCGFSQTPLNIAPNFTALDARGNYHDLYTHLNSGKYVVLDFFYNECLVCQTHVPEVNNAYIKFGCNTQDVFFLGVNLNNTDGEVVSFENEYALHYPNISGVDGGGNNIVELFQVIAFPTIILIAPDKSIPKQDIWPLTAVNIIDEILSVGVDTASCPYLLVDKTHQTNSFFVYPNPASDFLIISNAIEQNEILITIYDFMGKLIISRKLSGVLDERINIKNIHSGLYLINISKSDEILHSERLIIQ